jgi:hypothetical protein
MICCFISMNTFVSWHPCQLYSVKFGHLHC